MRLFIGNATKQIVDFIYRVPESGLRTQTIPIGGQIMISGELSKVAVDGVIDQHRKYGLIPADEIDRTRDFIGLCYSVDRQITSTKITRAMLHNESVLVQRGKQMRQDAAVAESLRLENSLEEAGRPEILRNFEASVIEENHDERDEMPAISEGVRVTRAPSNGNAPLAPARRKRAA